MRIGLSEVLTLSSNTRYARCADHALPEAEHVVFLEVGHASYVEYPKLFQKQVEVLAKKVWKPKQSNSKNNNNSNIFREE